MTVIPTDQWLLNGYEQPLTLCEKLKSHFGGQHLKKYTNI